MISKQLGGIEILSLLEIALGSLGVVFGLSLFFLNTVDWSAAIFSFAVLWLITGFALVKMKRWAWRFSMISSIISFVGSVVLFSLAQLFLLFFSPGLVCWPFVIYYLTRPDVKRFLRVKARP